MKLKFQTVLTLALLQAAAAAQSTAPIGYVAAINGTVHFQSVLDSSIGRLWPGVSVGFKLYEGDKITCDPGASATVRIGDIERVLTDRNHAVTIHIGSPTEAQKRANEALEKLGRPGASRSIGSLLYSPAADSAVRLATFHLRWNPPSDPEPLQFALTSANGKTLWSQANVDSSSGSLAPLQETDLVHAIAANGNAGLILAVTSEMHGSQHIRFALLTPAQDAALNADLKFWTSEQDPLLRLIGTAQALDAANLPVDAAAAYDEALKIAPQSEVLLETALGLQQSLGNRARVLPLRAALQAARAVKSAPGP